MQKIETPIFISLVALSILTPSITLSSSLPAVRLDFIFVFLSWTFIGLRQLLMGISISEFNYPIYKWFIFLGTTIYISTIYGAVVKDQPLLGVDFLELLKVFQYFLTFALIARFQISIKTFKRIYILTFITFVLSSIFAFFEHLNIFGINQWLTPFYVSTQLDTVLAQSRITGTTSNPNEFGALMVLAISLAFSGGIIFTEKKLRILCWLMFPVFFYTLFLTASRSALIAFFVSTVSIILMLMVTKGLFYGFWRIVGFIIICSALAVIAFKFSTEEMLMRFFQLEAVDRVTSLQARQENWITHIAYWKQSYWFGWGPAKATMSTIVDSEWIYLLRRYGIIGLSIFLGFYGSLFSALTRVRKIKGIETITAFSIALQGTLLGYAVYMMAAPVYHALQLMPILLLFLGLAYSQLKEIP
jgi:hypothetical protein